MPPVSGLLVLDTSYTYEMIKERGLEESVTCRDLEGYFGHVWSVHPFASLLTSPAWAPKFGRSDWHIVNGSHTFIEGKVGRYPWLGRFFAINLLLSQVALFVTLLRLIWKEDIKLIRVGDPLYSGIFGWALSRISRIPLVIRVSANNDKIREATGGPIHRRLFRRIAVEKAIERYVFKRADLVAAPNQDNCDFALRNGARPATMTVFRYGNLLAREHFVDPAARILDPALLAGLSVEKRKYLLHVGRLEPIKFVDDAVRVLGEIVRRRLDVKLVLAGEGQMRETLAGLAGKLGVADRIVFAGNLNQASLAQLIPNAAAVISPLTGRSLSEAALGAAPIVAYDLDWQGEIIKTGVSGELVSFREWERLADSVERFLRDRPYATAMGLGARRCAMEMLDPDMLNAHERGTYSALLKRHGSGQ